MIYRALMNDGRERPATAQEPPAQLDSRLRVALDELARQHAAPVGELTPTVARQRPSLAATAEAVRARHPLPNPYAVPFRATDLRGLPAATFIGARIDPVWSEGTFYARHLREAGVRVTYHDFPTMTHEFVGMTALLPQARQAIGMAVRDLEATLLALPARY